MILALVPGPVPPRSDRLLPAPPAAVEAPAVASPPPAGPTMTLSNGRVLALYPRGVYWVRTTNGGKAVCVGVDSTGDYGGRIAVCGPDDDADAAERVVWSLLDRDDPPRPDRPELTVVRAD